MTSWRDEAEATGLRVFPVRIVKSDGRWSKRPLVEAWQQVASREVSDFDWTRANGYGVLMGDGVYALDLDEYKSGCAAERWLTKWGVPMETRTHRTISGGRHLIYKLPDSHWDLRTRANVVAGLDTRGVGGFIAFGEGYEVLDPSPPAVLPINVCKELARGGGSLGAVTLPKYEPIAPGDLRAKFERAERADPRLEAMMALPDWDDERTDRTRSAADMAFAAYLSQQGWTISEIAQALLEVYPHGQAAKLKTRRWQERAAMRCAVKVTASREERAEKYKNAANKPKQAPTVANRYRAAARRTRK